MATRQTHAQITNEQVYYYHLDHLGTPIEMTDANQNVVWTATYDPFGTATINTATITNNLRFPGMYADAETGLYYNMNRYYYPAIGRYIEPDPILQPMVNVKLNTLSTFNELLASFTMNPQSLNAYPYTMNNPVNVIDPFGLQSQTTYPNQIPLPPVTRPPETNPCSQPFSPPPSVPVQPRPTPIPQPLPYPANSIPNAQPITPTVPPTGGYGLGNMQPGGGGTFTQSPYDR